LSTTCTTFVALFTIYKATFFSNWTITIKALFLFMTFDLSQS
jgi:hypothetical protein